MPEGPSYETLAALRAALTSNDADTRSTAYGAVYDADVEPSDVLGSEVPDDVRAALAAADVIPEDTGSKGQPQAEVLRDIRNLLETIADNTGGGS